MHNPYIVRVSLDLEKKKKINGKKCSAKQLESNPYCITIHVSKYADCETCFRIHTLFRPISFRFDKSAEKHVYQNNSNLLFDLHLTVYKSIELTVCYTNLPYQMRLGTEKIESG